MSTAGLQGEQPHSAEGGNLSPSSWEPIKEFKALVVRMLTELEKKLNEHGENFSKTRKYKKEPVRIEEYNNQNKKC